MMVQDLTASTAASIGLRNHDGALVVTVVSDAPAAQAGIRAGDVVVAVNDLPTRSAKALVTLIHQLRRGDRVILDIERKNPSGGAERLRLAAVL